MDAFTFGIFAAFCVGFVANRIIRTLRRNRAPLQLPNRWRFPSANRAEHFRAVTTAKDSFSPIGEVRRRAEVPVCWVCGEPTNVGDHSHGR